MAFGFFFLARTARENTVREKEKPASAENRQPAGRNTDKQRKLYTDASLSCV
jgi:hypothetical protein